MRLVKSKNRATKILGNTFRIQYFWCNLKLAQQRVLQFYQTRSRSVILYDTLPAEFIETAICMKTKDQLYQRESVIPRPRVVLEANSQSGSQDLPAQDARSSWESQQDAESYGETRSNTADYRIPCFFDLNGETAGCTATKGQSLKKHESIAGDQQVFPLPAPPSSTVCSGTIPKSQVQRFVMGCSWCVLLHMSEFLVVDNPKQNRTYKDVGWSRDFLVLFFSREARHDILNFLGFVAATFNKFFWSVLCGCAEMISALLSSADCAGVACCNLQVI